jgi:hypothetical protein
VVLFADYGKFCHAVVTPSRTELCLRSLTLCLSSCLALSGERGNCSALASVEVAIT